MIERLLEAERALAVGLLDQAERIYQQAVDADPRNSIAVVGLARVALERGDEARAYSLGLRALEIDGDNQAARRLVDRLVEVRAARGEAPPAAETRGNTAVAVAPTAPAPAPATTPARATPAPGVPRNATEGPAALAKRGTQQAPLHSRTRDVLMEMPQPTAPATRPAPPASKPIAVAPETRTPPAPAPEPVPEKSTAAAPPPERPAAVSAPAREKPVTPPPVSQEQPPREPAATVRPAEPKAPTPSPSRPAPEAPLSAARAANSTAPRKSKVTQPVTIRTAGSRRSAAPSMPPPKTTLPKAKPLMPPPPEPPKQRADEGRAEAVRETPTRAARPATREPAPPTARKMRKVEPKQPGLFDRLFRPRR